MAKKDDRLGRRMAYALRINPGSFGLEMDGEGWVDLGSFLKALGITEDQLRHEMENMDKRRFEVRDGRIRAFYGHSSANKVSREEDRPPDELYHGTSPFTAFVILRDGIRPMGRQYAHLSSDRHTAEKVGRRRHDSPTILVIDALGAWRDGVRFYRGNEDVWLADFVPPQWISKERSP